MSSDEATPTTTEAAQAAAREVAELMDPFIKYWSESSLPLLEAQKTVYRDGSVQSRVAEIISKHLTTTFPSCWRDIESAPKDGTQVILWWPYWRQEPVIGKWDGAAWVSEVKLYSYGVGSPDPGDDSDPKAWTPLPAPPVTDEEKEPAERHGFVLNISTSTYTRCAVQGCGLPPDAKVHRLSE